MNCVRNSAINFLLSFLTICLLLGVLAQVDILRSAFRPILYISWVILLAIYIIIFRHGIIMTGQAKVLTSMAVIIFVWRIILVILGRMESFPQLGTLVLIDLAAFLFGTWIADLNAKDKTLAKIMVFYSLAVGILAIYLMITYFPSIGAWFNSVVYQYSAKNSAAQLLAQAILFMLFLYPSAQIKVPAVIGQIVRYGVIGISVITIAFLRCRTAILALGVCALYYIFRLGGKKRVIYFAVLLLLGIVVVTFAPLREFVASALLLNKYGQNSTLDQFSSGRLSYMDVAIDTWMEHFWLGVGRIMVDCNPLALLADSGVLGAIPYYIFWLSTVKLNVFRRSSYNHFNQVIQLLTVYYCVSSLLEGYPPFGPGVCVAPMWLLSGYCEIKSEEQQGVPI